MAVGQGALTPSGSGRVLDVAALDAAELRLEVRAVARCHEHGRLLREVLDLHRVLQDVGAGLSTSAQVALLLQLSEGSACALLAEAQLLAGLPGALEALECGLMTPAQSAVLLRAVGHLPTAVQAEVWTRLQARLLSALDSGAVLTPARLAPLVTGWAVQADPAGAQERRRRAEAAADVTYRRRDDGVGDLFATGIPTPLLHAVLCRIREAAQPFGTGDDRTAGKRRADALVDLLLGRQRLETPVGGDRAGGTDHADGGASARGQGTRPPCGCRLHEPVPCGADVVVHVPLGAALGTTDELAELVGSGPLHPDQLSALLLNSPRLSAVHVDEHGAPVALGTRHQHPERHDAAAVRAALVDLATGPPGARHPRHPGDHRPLDPGAGRRRPVPGAALTGSPPPREHAARPCGSVSLDAAGGASRPSSRPAVSGPASDDRPRLLTGTHPTGTPGPYRPSRSLRRWVEVRSPRCEWPACGARAALCDLDHDLAWPAGPTCACNLGPLCRRHHQLKQLLLHKARLADGSVLWTDPTGRRWSSPAQHRPPAPPVRALAASVTEAAGDPPELSPTGLLELLAPDDTDPLRFELRAPDRDPDHPDDDPFAHRLQRDVGWGLSLDDPFAWAA